MNGPLGGVVASGGGAPIDLSGLANVVVGSAGSVFGGDGLSTVVLGSGQNTISLGGAFNTVVLGSGGDSVNTVEVGGGTGSVAFGANTLQVSYGDAFSATLAAAQWPGFAQPKLNGAANPDGWNIGEFNWGSGNIGAFNGLANASASSGNGNIGVFNGDVNGGANDGNYNIGGFNGGLNGLGNANLTNGNDNGNGNVGLLNGDNNGNLVSGVLSGNDNGNGDIGVDNGNSNGNGVGPIFVPSSAKVALSGGFDTVVVGSGVNHIDAAAGVSTLVAGNGVNVISIGGEFNTVVTGSGVSTILVSELKDSVIALGDGSNTIDLGLGSGQDTIVLPSQGYDAISNFSVGAGDRLDLGFLMSGTGWNGDGSTLGQWLSVEFVDGNTVLKLTEGGQGLSVAELVGLDVPLSTLMRTFVIDGAAVVPEPGALVLSCLGFAAIMWMRRRTVVPRGARATRTCRPGLRGIAATAI